jgi:hypothetical protein
VNREVIFCAAGVLSASPLAYFMRRDDSDLVVFCLPIRKTRRPLPSALAGAAGDGQPAMTLNQASDPSALFRTNENVSSSRRTGPIDGKRCSLRFGLKVTRTGPRPMGRMQG